MNNAELIKALRYCAEHEGCDYYIAKDCPREGAWVCGADCEQILMRDAADALEVADRLLDQNTKRCEALRKQLREANESYDKRIAELEAQLPKEGEWINPSRNPDIDNKDFFSDCSVCGETFMDESNYCPNCGARMRTVTDCHTLESER